MGNDVVEHVTRLQQSGQPLRIEYYPFGFKPLSDLDLQAIDAAEYQGYRVAELTGWHVWRQRLRGEYFGPEYVILDPKGRRLKDSRIWPTETEAYKALAQFQRGEIPRGFRALSDAAMLRALVESDLTDC